METSKFASQQAKLHTLVLELNKLDAYLRYSDKHPDELSYDVLWCPESDFLAPSQPSQQSLQSALHQQGFGRCRKSLAASLLLRFGWAAGFRIGAWLTHGWVLQGLQQSLAFQPKTALLSGLSIQQCQALITQDQGCADTRRELLVNELVNQSMPMVNAYHDWSGLSKNALWSMVCSSWAAQFIAICERLGQAERAITETDAIFSLHPITRRYRPELYTVRTTQKYGVCQRRHLCCLWFKSSPNSFCSSCPILGEEDRRRRNLQWIAEHGQPDHSSAAELMT